MRRTRWVIGLDEVGRGALAGPVEVAAVLAPRGMRFGIRALGVLKDSKKLSAHQREAWFDFMQSEPKLRFAFARVYPRNIERMNISRAANLAARRAFSRILRGGKGHGIPAASDCRIYLDGGLFLGNGGQPKRAKTLIKADEKINAVKLASIAAKVHRDSFMRRLAGRYRAYGFDLHKGYGTAAHRAAIKKYGPCDAHRLTFLGGAVRIKQTVKKQLTWGAYQSNIIQKARSVGGGRTSR